MVVSRGGGDDDDVDGVLFTITYLLMSVDGVEMLSECYSLIENTMGVWSVIVLVLTI